MKLIDLTGQIFGRLTVISRSENKHGRAYWRCKCECGNEKDVIGKELKSGNVKSCGCLRKEIVGTQFRTHGATETRLYYIWSSMKKRCENPYHEKHKKDYQGRGIAVCNEWHDFSVFQEWALANGYADNLSIDRIDNNKGYSPDNCRWTDSKTQANNKRNNVHITFNGITQTIAQWADSLGMAFNVLHNRISYLGWSIEEALTTPVRGRV